VTSVDTQASPAVAVGDVIVRVNPKFFRPAEVETLLGDPTKAKEKLGWVPEITVEEMCAEMVRFDIDKAKQHALLKKHGFNVSISLENTNTFSKAKEAVELKAHGLAGKELEE
jgi:GDPmannose 4,6-dehydratase